MRNQWISAVLLGALLLGASSLQAAEGQVVISGWAPLTPAVAGYNLYMATTAGGAFKKLNAALIGSSSYVVGQLEPGQRYYFQMSAVGKGSPGVESSHSAEFSRVAVAAPAAEAVAAASKPKGAKRGLDFEDSSAFRLADMRTEPASWIKMGLSQEQKHSGQSSLKLDCSANSGAMVEAVMIGVDPELCPFQAAHTGSMTFWVYSTDQVDLGMGFREGKGPGSDAVGWVSARKSCHGGGVWTKMIFPLGGFKRIRESRNGMDMNSNFGNGTMQLDCVKELQLQVGPGRESFYIDDITFE